MDQQVSPAVVIIVLILIVAILVGLYFLVIERRPQTEEGQIDDAAMPAPVDTPPMEQQPPTDADEPPAEPADTPAGDADQPAGQTEAEGQETGTPADQPSDAAGE